MRKNQIKHLFLKFIVFVGLAFLTFTCEQDKIVNETQEESILKNQKAPTIRTFSQDNIGDRFNDIVQQLNIRKYLKKSKDLSYTSRTSYDTLGVTIYTDEIKEVTIDDYKSYTMRMATPETDSTSFYNVTIEDDNGVTEMYVSKYTPTQAWLENKDQVYEGNISTMRVNDFTTVSPDDGGGTNEDYGGLGNNYSEPQGSPYYPTDCIGVVIITYENIPYPCGCGDMPWDNCQGCPPSIGYPQYPAYNQIPYYYCEEYADQINDSAQNDNTNTDTTTGGTTTTGNGNNSNPDNNLVTVTLTPLECSPAPRGDLDGDCQLDAYETYMNVKQCLEQNDYTLNQAQSDYLQTNFTQTTTINNYLQNNNCSQEAQEVMIDFLIIKEKLPDAKLDRYLELLELIEADPWVLIQDCLQEFGLNTSIYNNLYQYSIPQECIDKLNELGEGYNNQPITDGNVPLANIDYYGIEIINSPDFNNDGQPDSNNEVYQAFRNDFLNLASGLEQDVQFNCNIPANYQNTSDVWRYFNPLTLSDESLFLSENPVTSIILINSGASGLFTNLAADEGAIIVSDFTQNDWTISTITTPDTGTQPFSGNRQWGYYINSNGNLELFTRAVDVARVSDLILFDPFNELECQQDDYYNVAEMTWKNMQEEIEEWVNTHGGNAIIIPEIAKRIDKNRIQELLESNETIDQILCD